MRTRLALAIAAALAATGCSKKEKEAPSGPPVKVNLPPSPPMDEPKFVEKYVDGSYTVAGLVQGRARLLGSSVQVKGYVQTIHRCADGTACDPPTHAVLVDDLSRPGKRLVVVSPDIAALAPLQQGQGIMVEGQYEQSDPDGLFVRMEGVLVLPAPPEPAEDGGDDAR